MLCVNCALASGGAKNRRLQRSGFPERAQPGSLFFAGFFLAGENEQSFPMCPGGPLLTFFRRVNVLGGSTIFSGDPQAGPCLWISRRWQAPGQPGPELPVRVQPGLLPPGGRRRR